jgi:hypothetical protein
MKNNVQKRIFNLDEMVIRFITHVFCIAFFIANFLEESELLVGIQKQSVYFTCFTLDCDSKPRVLLNERYKNIFTIK